MVEDLHDFVGQTPSSAAAPLVGFPTAVDT
jgi:hypothetical protein